MSDNKTSNKVPSKPKKVSANIQAPVRTVDKSVNGGLNAVLWLLALGLVIGVSVLNQFNTHLSSIVRLLIVVASIVVALVCFLLTNQGRKLLKFGMESILELRKIYYPTKKEALQTSIIVVVISVLVSFMFWFFDFVIQYFVKLITTWSF